MNQYIAIYKPFNVLSQFTSQEGKTTLKDIVDVSKDVYPVGRLDYDSEGLLILTNDKKLNHELLNPIFKHKREYWVQLDGAITDEAVSDLAKGVDITIDGKTYRTARSVAEKIQPVPQVPERNPPIRFRATIPTSWIRLLLTEGKNRQVRKMTAAVGFPTLRLIRWQIENLSLEGLQPGEMRMFSEGEIRQLLFPGRQDLPK